MNSNSSSDHPSPRPANKPIIGVVGKIIPRGSMLVAAGWRITACLAQCPCHLHPLRQQVVLYEEPYKGLLGLVSFTATGRCTCCEPWTIDELQVVLRDLAAVEQLETTSSDVEPTGP